MRLSQSVEDYLKAVFKLREQGETVSKKDIADTLDVSPASVTNMVKKLAEMKLVEHESYRGVRLTPTGERVALEIVRHHRLLETYLREVMGFSWQEMHDEAEKLEHHISEEFESRIDEMLGYPTHDPHGHPIPSLDGDIAIPATIALTEISPGQTVTVHHVGDADPEILTYLERIGLMPRTVVQIVDKAPFDGPITISVENRKEVIGNRVAGDVYVVDE